MTRRLSLVARRTFENDAKYILTYEQAALKRTIVFQIPPYGVNLVVGSLAEAPLSQYSSFFL